MRTKTNVFIGVVLFYIAYTTLPLFSGLLRLPVWMPSIFVSTVLFILFPKILKNKTIHWFLLYVLFSFLFMYFGRVLKLDIGTSTQLDQLLIEYSFFLPNICIALVLTELKDKRVFRVVFIGFIFLLLLSFIVILPQLQQTDLRQLAIALEEGRSMETLNNLGYTLLHVYVIILPAFFFCSNNSKGLLKICFIVLLALLLYIIFKSSITTTLLISLGVVLISFAHSFKNKNVYYILLFSFALVFIMLYYGGGVIRILDWISPYFEETAVLMKIEDLKMSLVSGQLTGGSIVSRRNLHQISWDSFFSNPLIGGGDFGGHSSLIDRLACMGLIGFIPYFMIYWTIVKQWMPLIKENQPRYYYILGIIIVIVLLYSKGLFGNEGNLFFMVLLPTTIVTMWVNKDKAKNKKIVAIRVKKTKTKNKKL